ncbi:MAG: CCA tRNA nucleotidyltransferase [Melioribacteraceae bacterium]|nr:CCA tRNA nucleotidyltransferase [Melioribacteraceae bacterium]MCF8355489.1 CCA tRNA nucleotidyltransferase [Melioribacteraceae bacterium]MCF8394914.1 CCA tRNA nucleotidyltransferase [Melioribacteraceae bacterium]MCF8420444.1 CCA tRNA nucleotidyltransferase [Melioribacteraceae bacterium]
MSVEIFAVGGYARDLILNRRRVDIDILVVGDGPAFAKKFSEKLGINDINIFSNFGTAHFRYHDLDFEFVGARRESYKKNSRNPFVEPGSFEDDINRRDFTINTLAVSLNKDSFGELIDVFGGLNDIKNKIIRTPLDPMITFDDDPLRILRAFRFAAQLNFDVSESIIEAARSLKERMKIIVTERKTDEFLKIISSVKPSIGLKLMYDTGIMDEVFPEISNLAGVDQRKEHHHKDVFLHTLQVLDNIAEKTDDLWLRFAALVHDIAKPPTKRFIEGIGWTFHGHEDLGARMLKPIFKRMKLPMSKLEYVQKLVRLHLRPIALVDDEVTDSAIRRLVVNADEDLEDLITLCRADITSKNPRKVSKYLNNYEKVMQKVREVKEKDKLRAFQSPVRGEEIMKVCGIPPSKTVGKIKSAIEEAILDGKIRNDYDEAYNYFLKIKDQYLE